jgi:hypothetical protein
VAARLVPLLVGGGAATCRVTDLQVVAGFADPEERAAVAAERAAFPVVPIDDDVLARAAEVQVQISGAPVAVTALIVAAATELAGLVLLHDDPDLSRIAEVTGQPTEPVDP